MNINANNLNFCGRYVLKGNRDRINIVATGIKQVKGKKVEFLPLICKNANYAIVATDEDALTLRQKKTQPQLYEQISQFKNNKYIFLSEVFKYLFGSDKNALLLEGDHLAKFCLVSYLNDYNDGSIKGRKSLEKFVDGTYKKYTGPNSRLTEYLTPQGDVVSIDIDGTKTIKKINGEIEIEEPQKASKPYLQKTVSKDETPQKIVSETIVPKVTSSNRYYNTFATTPKKETMQPKQIQQNKVLIGVEIPFRDGIMQVLDENGNIQKLIFPDGTKKIFAPNGGIAEKILPDGTRELFNDRGRMYMTVSPDGTKKYNSKIVEIEG